MSVHIFDRKLSYLYAPFQSYQKAKNIIIFCKSIVLIYTIQSLYLHLLLQYEILLVAGEAPATYTDQFNEGSQEKDLQAEVPFFLEAIKCLPRRWTGKHYADMAFMGFVEVIA